MATVPAALSISFIVLVAIMYSFLIVGVLYADVRHESPARLPFYTMKALVGGFLLITGLAALSGFFLDFQSMPPKFAFAVVPGFIGMLVLAFNRRMRRWLQEIPHAWLVGLQVFRLVVEIQLHYLAKTPLLPELMTFNGRNFDILVGLTAPLMAWYAHTAENRGLTGKDRKIISAWNVFGLALLVNVVVHGILSTPTPFRQFFVEPPNVIMGYFPFIWLPAFLVPYAFFLHILSLRKLAGERRR